MLNINKYAIKAKYIPTNRQRTVTVEARNEEEALQKLGPDFTDIKSVVVNNRPPTDRQIDYARSLGIVITGDMCFEDVSALISSKTDDRHPPKQGLIDFADAHNISFSNYAGKKNLYARVFQGLPQREAIAFFVFCVYRHLSDDRESNLDKSPYRNNFYEFAGIYENDNKFVKSLYDNYYGADLRFFGTLHVVDGNEEFWDSGGNVKTYAFRCAKQFLINRSLVAEDVRASKTIRGNSPRPQDEYNQSTYEEEDNYEQYLYMTEDAGSQDSNNDIPVMPAAAKASGSGCLLPIMVIVLSICALAALL